MRKKIKIISLSLVIGASLTFISMQLFGSAYAKDIEAPESDRTKAIKTVSNMLKSYKKRKWKNFKSCWVSTSNKEIKEEIDKFDEGVPSSFEAMECVLDSQDGFVIIRGIVDTAPEVVEFKIQKNKNSYKIKSINKQFM